MISVKKKGTGTWKYSWHIGKAIRGAIVPLYSDKVDAVEWSIVQRVKNNDQVVAIVVEGFNSGLMVFRISAKAVHLADSVQILISSKIDY